MNIKKKKKFLSSLKLYVGGRIRKGIMSNSDKCYKEKIKVSKERERERQGDVILDRC